MNRFNAIFVTGYQGFLCCNYLRLTMVLYPHTRFIAIDKGGFNNELSLILDKNDYENLIQIEGDICDTDNMLDLLLKYKVDAILHMAADTNVDLSYNNSIDFTRNNVTGTHSLLEAARLYGKLKRFIFTSTDEVYNFDNNNQPDETCNLAPTNPYSASKAAAEMYCMAYYKSYGVPVIITRSNNIFGPYQDISKVIPTFINNILNNKYINIHGDGNQKRTFIYVNDVVSAINTILNLGNVGESYNIGGTMEITINALAQYILCRIKPDLTKEQRDNMILYGEDRPFQDKRYNINCSKLKCLGWKEQHNAYAELNNYIRDFDKYKCNGIVFNNSYFI